MSKTILRVFVLTLFLALLLACNSEKVTVVPVVIDGRITLPTAARLTGKTGFAISAKELARALGGHVEEVNAATYLIVLEGKRVLVSYSPANVGYDHYVKSSPFLTNGVLQFSGPAIKEIIAYVYPQGSVERQNERVLINRGR